MASASGTSYAVGPGRSSRTYGASRATSVNPSWCQKRTVAGSSSRASTASRRKPTAASSAAPSSAAATPWCRA